MFQKLNHQSEADVDLDHSLSHLKELRTRLIRCVFVVALLSCFCYLKAQFIFDLLALPLTNLLKSNPLKGQARSFIYTNLTEAFLVYVKIAVFSGFFLSFPYITFELWNFIAPGLYKKEKFVFLAFVILSPFLFLSGAIFAYFYVLPLAYEFFLSFEIPVSKDAQSVGIQLQAKIQDYLSFVIRLTISFGLSFNMPVLICLLAKIGLVTKAFLIQKWRLAVVCIFGVSAIITPPDILSMLSLSLPLIFLYILSIFLVNWIGKEKS
jgi:sec-independent protein translocase protein TatC